MYDAESEQKERERAYPIVGLVAWKGSSSIWDVSFRSTELALLYKSSLEEALDGEKEPLG